MEEELKNTSVTTSEETKTEVTQPTPEEKKANAIAIVITFLTNAMKAAFSRGEADTVWYKKGIYYTGAIILAGLVYAFSMYGTEIFDWCTELVKSIF